MSASNAAMKAAVLLPLFVKNAAATAGPSEEHLLIPGSQARVPVSESTAVLFTVRTRNVEHHKGQISFPGGVFEKKDASLLETALRETEEEIGLPRDAIRVVSSLPSAVTATSHFEIHPFVGIIEGNTPLRVNFLEIEELLFVPLPHLLDPKNQRYETIEKGGVKYKIKSYFFEDHRIWGATARILSCFLS